MEEVKIQESWNKKRIFGALFLIVGIIVLGYFLKTRVLSENSSPTDSSKAVKGTTNVIEESEDEDKGLNINIQKAVQEKIESIKQDVKGINIVEVASSSPQIQKIINDIKALEQYPTNQARELCRQICSF